MDTKKFTPLLTKLEEALKNGNIVLAIEGGSAAGKTTLASLLEQIYDCTTLHMDDFFLRPEQRTKERLAEPGGNVDRERFLEEVLLPLSRRESIQYHAYNCATSSLSAPKQITAKALTVVEGAYSMHPDLAPFYDLSVFLDIDKDLQKKRIEKRNTPEMAERFFKEWIPMEELYFETLSPKTRCNLIIKIEE